MKKVYIALFFLSITVQIFHAATFDCRFTGIITQEDGENFIITRPDYFDNATMCNIFLETIPRDHDKDKDAVLTIPKTIIQVLKALPKTASLKLAIIDLTGNQQPKTINISELEKAFKFNEIMTKGTTIKIQSFKVSREFKLDHANTVLYSN